MTKVIAPGGRRTIACLKRALYRDGVISCPHVAARTPALTAVDAERFEEIVFVNVGFVSQNIADALAATVVPSMDAWRPSTSSSATANSNTCLCQS